MLEFVQRVDVHRVVEAAGKITPRRAIWHRGPLDRRCAVHTFAGRKSHCSMRNARPITATRRTSAVPQRVDRQPSDTTPLDALQLSPRAVPGWPLGRIPARLAHPSRRSSESWRPRGPMARPPTAAQWAHQCSRRLQAGDASTTKMPLLSAATAPARIPAATPALAVRRRWRHGRCMRQPMRRRRALPRRTGAAAVRSRNTRHLASWSPRGTSRWSPQCRPGRSGRSVR
jgi:hypothetical protein